MRDIALAVIIFGSVPLILMRPWIGVLMFSWVGYMNPHKMAYGFAFDMQFAAVLAVATLVGLLFDRGKKSIPINAITVIWVLFIIHMSITTIMAIYPAEATLQWKQVIKIQLMCFVTIMLMRSRERVIALVWVIVFSIGFFGVKGGIFSLSTGFNHIVWGPGGLIEGNNELALALIMIVPLLRFLQLDAENKWIRYGLVVSMALCVMSIIASYSRGAFLACSVMGLALAMQSKYKIRVLAVLLVVGVIGLSFVPQQWSDRMGTIQTYEEDGSAMGRINSWYFAVELAKDYPVVGGGFGSFTPELFERFAPDPEDFHDSHSIYFGILGHQGFVGLALFVLLGLMTLIANGRLRRTTKNLPELEWVYNLASMIRVSLIGYATGGLFLGLQYFDLYYHLVAMTVILQLIVQRELRNRVPTTDVSNNIRSV